MAATDASAMWGSAPWERAAGTMAAVHDRLVAALGPRPGERWLGTGTGTGTGAVALRTARCRSARHWSRLCRPIDRGGEATGGPGGLAIDFAVGDAQAMPYVAASYDVVSSAHGVVFAPDHAAAAPELARVCRPSGRLGMTAWRQGEAGDELDELVGRFMPPRPAVPRPGSWGEEHHARELLGEAFELEFVDDVWIQAGESGEAIWQPRPRARGASHSRRRSTRSGATSCTPRGPISASVIAPLEESGWRTATRPGPARLERTATGRSSAAAAARRRG
jgi:SAM-dependent methyltransferase